MKKMLFFLAAAALFSLSAKDLNVLAIGNSFSVCVGRFLPQIVKSVPGENIVLTSANIGGCQLERHWTSFLAAEKNPKLKQYKIDVWNTKTGKKTTTYGSLFELLKTKKYDVITIQQQSSRSISYSTYQPYAKNLIAEIKKYQPDAEIVIQQTWSYRADSDFFVNAKMSNDEMYQKLNEAYIRLAKENNFRMIPTGYAVQLSRKNSPVKFKKYDAAALKEYHWPDFPSQAGDVVGKLFWRKAKSGKMQIYCDAIHLNIRGEYLQAAVWFSFLYGKNTSEIKFVPREIGDDDAEFLRKCAQQAVNEYKQVKK